MFTTRHYIVLATMLHNAYTATNGTDEWKTIYEHVYTPLVQYLDKDNPNFSMLTFAWAVATGEMHGEFDRRATL